MRTEGAERTGFPDLKVTPSFFVGLFFFLLPLSGVRLFDFSKTMSLSPLILASGALVLGLALFFPARSLADFPRINRLFFPPLLVNFLLAVVSLALLSQAAHFRHVFSHLMVILYMGALACYAPYIRMRDVYNAGFLGGLVLALADFAACAGYLTTSVPHADILGLGYAGQGLRMTFANHGAGIAVGVVSGLMVFPDISGGWKRLCVAGAIALMLAMLVLTQSRSSYLAVLAAAAVLALYFPNHLWRAEMKKKVFWYAFFLAASMMGIYFFVMNLIGLRQRTADIRMDLNRQALEILMQNPFGIGWEVWERYHYTGYYIHNMVLNYAVALGYPGLALVLVLAALPLWYVWQVFRGKYLPSWHFYGGLAICAAGLTIAMFEAQTPSQWINPGLFICAASLLEARRRSSGNS